MSPPPSSSSSSATSTVTCLAGILRRMLCSRSLPTHPTDLITESTSVTACDSQEQGLENGAENNIVAPSLVAKLMGLDSMPNVIITSTVTTTSSISGSRSSDHGMKKGEHGRMKSTLSLGEMPMPTFFELEDFFVLSFENGSEKKQKRLKERKCEEDIGGLKQTSEESCVSLEFVELRKNKKRRKKKRKKKVNVELECSSEESSPVSVLDFDQFVKDHDFLSSHSLESNSRRKLSPEPENFECQSRLRNDNNLMILDDLKTKKADGKCVGVGSRKKDCKYDQICKIVEADILESNWLCSRKILKHEDFEDIYADFESQILDQLLHELLVHQLIRLPL